MTSQIRPSTRMLIGAVLTCLLCPRAPVLGFQIIWQNGGDDGQNILASQLDLQYPFNGQVADDFSFTDGPPSCVTQWLVTGVRWNGAYFNNNGPTVDGNYDFNIIIYADNGTGASPTGGPGDPTATAIYFETFPNSEVNETPTFFGFGVQRFSYSVELTAPFLADANTQYWLTVQSIGTFPLLWGWAHSVQPQQLSGPVIGFPVFGLDYWTLASTVSSFQRAASFALIGSPVFDGDCNNNNIPDDIDIAKGTSQDCTGNGIPDECEIAINSTAPGGPFFCASGCCEPDCNNNGIPDSCDIASLTSNDCNNNGIPDECDIVAIPTYDISFGDLINVPNDCGNGPFNDCISPTGFSWLDAGTGPVTAVQIEFNIGFNCHAAGTILDTSLNSFADQPFILSELGHCSCALTPGVQVGIDADPASYNPGAVNTFLITNPTTCLGFASQAAWGDGIFARVTVQDVRDCNANGIPDECETCGDLDGDGDVDADDFTIFLGAFGLGGGAVGFEPCADADGDGVVTFVDYQRWLECFRSFVGNPLAPPPMPEGVGDMDASGTVDGSDIQPFIEAMLEPSDAGFRARFMADANGDGAVDSADVGDFVGLLLSP